MKTSRPLAALVVALGFVVTHALAQNEFPLTMRGTCFQTNAAGKIVSQVITEKTLLQEVAQNVGITNLKGLALVYHENGSSFGDTIDVINPTNGVVLDTLFGFYFGESFDRMVLTNSSGAEKRLDYVYTKQNTHSLGSALINKSAASNGNGKGKGNARKIDGQMKWIVAPENNNGVVKICVAKFKTGPQLPFTGSQ